MKKYLQLEQARFGDRLQVNIHLDPAAEDALVIPMLLQPLVENAIRHGISPLVDGGCIAVKIEEKDGQIHISIRDTGIGFTPNAKTSGQGIGLGNTRRRLQLKYGSELFISPNQPQGTAIQITIPREAYHAESNPH